MKKISHCVYEWLADRLKKTRPGKSYETDIESLWGGGGDDESLLVVDLRNIGRR